MKELKPVKETYYLLDSVSEDNLEDDLKKLNEEISKYGLFLQHYQLELKTSLGIEKSFNHVSTSSLQHVLHLLYENRNQQEKEFNFALSTNLVVRNNFKNRETDIVTLDNIEMFSWIEGYYKCDNQYLVPASSL